jgi:hypothetical protein
VSFLLFRVATVTAFLLHFLLLHRVFVRVAISLVQAGALVVDGDAVVVRRRLTVAVGRVRGIGDRAGVGFGLVGGGPLMGSTALLPLQALLGLASLSLLLAPLLLRLFVVLRQKRLQKLMQLGQPAGTSETRH